MSSNSMSGTILTRGVGRGVAMWVYRLRQRCQEDISQSVQSDNFGEMISIGNFILFLMLFNIF